MSLPQQFTIFDASAVPSSQRTRSHAADGVTSKENTAHLNGLTAVQFGRYRDRKVLQAIAAYRALTAEQLMAVLPDVFPNTTPRKCRICLKRLLGDGCVLRVELYRTRSQPNQPYVYLLTSKGTREIADTGGSSSDHLDWSRHDRYVTPSHFKHLIESNWVRIRVEQSARAAGLALTAWHDERTLRRTHAQDLVTIIGSDGEKAHTHVYPDGYFVASGLRRTINPFIETDLDTERLRTHTVSPVTAKLPNSWTRKVNAYNAYFARKKGESLYSRRYGAGGEQVLTVTTSPKHLTNLKRATEAAGGKRRFWFTTLDQVKRENVFTAPIWQIASVAGDCSLVAGPAELYPPHDNSERLTCASQGLV
jgi:Replication-relaxation